MDFIQDPLIGWAVDRAPSRMSLLAGIAALSLAIGFLLLFSIPPLLRTDLWLAGALVLLFTAYSLATILIYGQSIAIAEADKDGSHLKVAGYREAGLIFGVVLAAIAPSVLGALGLDAYKSFGLVLAAFTVVAWWFSRDLWGVARVSAPQLRLRDLHAAGATYMLALALLNALPVALTSTLFLFFVEDRLQMPDMAGLFLILFFAAAGVSAPVWSRAARRRHAKTVLVFAMVLSIVAFIGAATLAPGAALSFALICIASGIALGADMVILPALFSTRLSEAGMPAGQAFGFWAFVSKAALALAALAALPFLQSHGYVPGGANDEAAIRALNVAYAILPCALKLLVIAVVLRLPRQAFAT